MVFLGPPGSGKGTQAARLSEDLDVATISTGDMLRAAVAAGSELGGRVESIMSSGALVGDDTMAEVVRDRLSQTDARSGFILDGYPRTAAQAETLGEILQDQGVELDHVLLLEVPEDELIERMSHRSEVQGRADDRAEVVRGRLQVYRESTQPLIELYRQQGLLRRIDGDRPIDEVAASLRAVFDRAVGTSEIERNRSER
ncbi:MAG TPA: adenylate kinase [Thermoanaerobaculia bacterium]|nr:adenylate kinase [Thermoanaerobaculia bacterium]